MGLEFSGSGEALLRLLDEKGEGSIAQAACGHRQTAEFVIDQPRLWNAEQPNLYYLMMECEESLSVSRWPSGRWKPGEMCCC